MILTSLGRFLTCCVIGFAVANTVVGVMIGEPWYVAGMLGFLLLCQIGVTFAESYEVAEEECRSVTTALDAAGKVTGTLLFYDAIRGRPIMYLDGRQPNGDETSAAASVDADSSLGSSAPIAADRDVESG